jgi:conjugative transfer region protein (TIGR03750 family)
MADSREVLADRLNAEPVIFKGCSSTELGLIVGLAAAVWLPLSLLVAGGLGAVTMGFGLAGIGIVATVLLVASLFQGLKRNRPDGYYQQRVMIWLHTRGLRRAPFVLRSGAWDIGRTADASLPPRDR